MRNLLKMLFFRADQADRYIAPIYIDRQPVKIDIDAVLAADQAEITEQPQKSNLGDVTQQGDEFALMEYEDAAGNLTRRRITIHQTKSENGLFYLHAFCHERQAIRSFRADRAKNFITADGEVIPAQQFLLDNLGIEVDAAKPKADRQAILLRRIKDQLRDPLTVLIGLAKCDGHIHVDELDCIQIFAEREILSRNAPNIFDDMPMIATLDGLCRSIGLMRPRAPTIATSISRLGDLAPEQTERFLATVTKVIRADGQIAAEEIDLLQEMRWLCGAEMSKRLEAISDAMDFAQT